MRAGLTREGGVLAAFTLAAAAVGLVSSDNLVLMVVSALVAVWLLEAFLGGWNLRHLDVVRRLPAELYAGYTARGTLVVANQRRWLPSVAVQVAEAADRDVRAVVDRVAPGGECVLSVGWRFPDRGVGRLSDLELTSSWPFGLIWRRRRVRQPVELLVYPRPRPGPHATRRGDDGAEQEVGGRHGAYGDLVGLRAYQSGDRPRAIHWPTTARVGEVTVVQHGGLSQQCLVVRVPDRGGRAWEEALSGATGEVLRGFEHGCAVGLELPDERLAPRIGTRWRRTLLDALARAPRRP